MSALNDHDRHQRVVPLTRDAQLEMAVELLEEAEGELLEVIALRRQNSGDGQIGGSVVQLFGERNSELGRHARSTVFLAEHRLTTLVGQRLAHVIQLDSLVRQSQEAARSGIPRPGDTPAAEEFQST